MDTYRGQGWICAELIAYTYGNIKHEHVIEDDVSGEEGSHQELRELQPWYSKFRQAKQESKVDENPLDEQPPRRVAIFYDL
jgi:hypothetical protein